MTTKQLIKAWDEFLSVEFGCYTDENGNRPCDNGAVCDRCSDEKIYENFCKKNRNWGLTKASKYDIINIEIKKRGNEKCLKKSEKKRNG